MSVIDERRKQLKLLCKLYSMTDAYHLAAVPTELLLKETGFDQVLFDKTKNYLLNEGLLVSKYIGYTNISHKGIVEVESILENPTMDTTYFPAYTLNHIEYDERIVELFYNLKIKRSQFLHKVYEATDGDETKMVNAFDIANWDLMYLIITGLLKKSTNILFRKVL